MVQPKLLNSMQHPLQQPSKQSQTSVSEGHNIDAFPSTTQKSLFLLKQANTLQLSSLLHDQTIAQMKVLNSTHLPSQENHLGGPRSEDIIAISILLGICGLAVLIPFAFMIWDSLVRFSQLLTFA